MRSSNARLALAAGLIFSAVLGPAAAAAAPASAAQAAFRLCDSRAFVALTLARTYLFEGRDRGRARALVKDHAWGRAMAEDLFRRAEAGTLRHHAEFAGDVLAQCAVAEGIPLGVSTSTAQLCLARADAAYLLHGERSRGVARDAAMTGAAAQLQPRELYPAGLIASVADAVYRPPALPELRRLSSEVVWSCIRGSARAASAASR